MYSKYDPFITHWIAQVNDLTREEPTMSPCSCHLGCHLDLTDIIYKLYGLTEYEIMVVEGKDVPT